MSFGLGLFLIFRMVHFMEHETIAMHCHVIVVLEVSNVPLPLSSQCLVSAEIEPVRADMIRINELFTRLYPGIIRLRTFYTRHYVTYNPLSLSEQQ